MCLSWNCHATPWGNLEQTPRSRLRLLCSSFLSAPQVSPGISPQLHFLPCCSSPDQQMLTQSLCTTVQLPGCGGGDSGSAFSARSAPAVHIGLKTCLFSDGVSRSERHMGHRATMQLSAKCGHWVTHTTIWLPQAFTLLCQTTLELQPVRPRRTSGMIYFDLALSALIPPQCSCCGFLACLRQ